MTRTFLKATAVAAMTLGAASAASAQTGFINLVGQLQVSSTPGQTTPLNIDILSGAGFPQTGVGFGTTGNVTAGTATGLFAGLTGTQGQMEDLQVTGGGTGFNTVPAGRLNQFLRIGAYTFNFGTVTQATGGTLNFGPISLEDTQGGVDARIVVANASIMGGNCTPMCTANGLITAQFAQYAGPGGSTRLFNDVNAGVAPVGPVSFSANFNATVIPEPSTYALLATGIAALGAVARRRRQQA
jgi:hypothetical protein